MTIHDLIFIPAMGIGGAFFPAADCTSEWVLRSWHEGHYRSARETMVCKDEPFLTGKAPRYVLDVARDVATGTAPTLAPITARMTAHKRTDRRAGTAWGHVVTSGTPAPRQPHTPASVAPVSLPAAGGMLALALAWLAARRFPAGWLILPSVAFGAAVYGGIAMVVAG